MPKIPKVRIAAVLKKRDEIQWDDDVNSYFACELEANLFDEFVGAVFVRMPTGVRYDVLHESLQYMAGQQLDRRLLYDMSWRLAGNLGRLKAGKVVHPWTKQQAPEWVPMQVVNGRLVRNKFGHPGALLTFRIMSGSPCPLSIQRFWSRRFCYAVSRRLGFSVPWERHPFRSPMELVTLRLMGLVDPELCRGGPGFDQILDPSPASCLTWNRSIIKMRARLTTKDYQCPKDYPSSHLCHLCPIGQDQCGVSVHPETFVIKKCSKCEKRTWFDKAMKSKQCVDCDAQEQL